VSVSVFDVKVLIAITDTALENEKRMRCLFGISDCAIRPTGAQRKEETRMVPAEWISLDAKIQSHVDSISRPHNVSEIRPCLYEPFLRNGHLMRVSGLNEVIRTLRDIADAVFFAPEGKAISHREIVLRGPYRL